MVEEIARQASAMTQRMFVAQAGVAVAAGKIQRLPIAHLARQSELRDQRLKATHGVKAGAIPAHGALEAVKPDQFAQRTVDLPQQHGGAGHGAAAARHLAIDDDNLMSPPGQVLGHQRAGDAGADDQ